VWFVGNFFYGSVQWGENALEACIGTELEHNLNQEIPRKTCAIETGKTITLIALETTGKTLLSTEESERLCLKRVKLHLKGYGHAMIGRGALFDKERQRKEHRRTTPSN
jgi:hypothetical protein